MSSPIPPPEPTALESAKAALERIILDPTYHDLLAIVKAARNGAVYGAKVRFPHALVMVFLFRPGTFSEKASLVFRATRTHAQNLARFAVIYKLVCYVLKHLGSRGGPGKEGPYDTLLAGLVGGYAVFGGRGKRSGKIPSVNQQIVVYVFARVVLALARLAVKPADAAAGVAGGLPFVSRPDVSARISHYAWPVFAAASWGAVMHLFRYHPEELQSSLRSSMTYIYQQSDSWDGLRNFIWHNK
ncbi:peroxisomal membrane protein 4 [Annulohypoxylon truncatum]|uniref:peroxisomal membrane protein 4 n=1 Tax=Annulohypoxylon truncatum TaxID=327061 RepID=UPI002007E339|nr:peroxisomal membrane protein 4 [Annulohypoxylon truncatum]KAI1208996.1 peroxisomal membrane protein 4 [Annulohypoxylon truncatum]